MEKKIFKQSQETQSQDELSKLLSRTLFSYSFDEKSDAEIIYDAIERAKKYAEFAIYKLNDFSSKWVYVPSKGVKVETKYIELHPYNIADESKFLEIKVSSFIYPLTLPDLESKIVSKISNHVFFNYRDLDSALDNLIGCNILVTTCWMAFPSIGGGPKQVVNIEKLPDKLEDAAKPIRFYFAKERIRMIKEVLENPRKYTCSSLKEEKDIQESLDRHRQMLMNELVRLESINLEDEKLSCSNLDMNHRFDYSFGKYSGSYAQDNERLSDEFIDDVLGGEPDAYWNID